MAQNSPVPRETAGGPPDIKRPDLSRSGAAPGKFARGPGCQVSARGGVCTREKAAPCWAVPAPAPKKSSAGSGGPSGMVPTTVQPCRSRFPVTSGVPPKAVRCTTLPAVLHVPNSPDCPYPGSPVGMPCASLPRPPTQRSVAPTFLPSWVSTSVSNRLLALWPAAGLSMPRHPTTAIIAGSSAKAVSSLTSRPLPPSSSARAGPLSPSSPCVLAPAVFVQGAPLPGYTGAL